MCNCNYRKLIRADNELLEFVQDTSIKRTIATPGMIHCKNQVATLDMLKLKKLSPSLLSRSDIVIGQGVFGICKMSHLQGTAVCVKQIKDTHTSQLALLHEAAILSILSHHSLCWLIGVQVKSVPNELVIPFYSINGTVVELYDLLFKKEKEVIVDYFTNQMMQLPFWISVLLDLADGIQYVHNLNLVHRDLKTDNVVFYKYTSNMVRPVIIDFGKCHQITLYQLTEDEQMKYRKKYPHIAPDLINGSTIPTPLTDIYSYGRIMKYIILYGGIEIKLWNKKVIDICKQCLQPNSKDRPTTEKILMTLS